jgi:hypothetical protein
MDTPLSFPVDLVKAPDLVDVHLAPGRPKSQPRTAAVRQPDRADQADKERSA